MKKVFTTLCLVFVMSSFANISRAGTYYVISGQPFSLTPAAGSNFFQYLWTIDPGVGQTIQTLDQESNGVLTHTFSDATSSPTLHKITLGVLEVLGGCLSEVVEHTIIVLPQLTVSITADKSNFCTNVPVNAELTATVTATTGLSTYSVSVSPFAWTKDGTTVSGQSASILTVTGAGNYGALVSYILPTTGTYAATASKLTNSVIGGTKQILNNLPIPTTPVITLN
jgi:hypothetical protein